jgi:DNA-binding transcriptional LysR family regulator
VYQTPSVELRHLRYFVAVAEELHFSRAAVRLRIAQPALSQQIRRLEQDLGVALFNRTKRRVELTPAGRALLEEGGRVLAQAERAARTAQRAARGEIGPLAIGFVPSADLDILPRILRVWRARFPDVEIVLHALLPAAQVEALRDGRIQIGFVRMPIEQSGLVVESIQREPLLAALPQRHRFARAERVRLGDLARDTMILFPRDIAPGYYDIYMGACRRAGFTPRVLHPGSMQTNLALVSAGLGVTLMPASIRSLRRAGVVYRALAPPVPHVEMAVAYRPDHRSAVLPPFLDVLHRIARPGRARGRRPAEGAPARAAPRLQAPRLQLK